MRLTQQAQLSCPHRPQSSPKGLARMSAEPFSLPVRGTCSRRRCLSVPGGEESLGIPVHLSPGGWSRGRGSDESMTLRCGVPGRRSVWRYSATRALYLPSTKRSVTRDTQQESVRYALTGRACTTHTPASPRTAVGVSRVVRRRRRRRQTHTETLTLCVVQARLKPFFFGHHLPDQPPMV